MSSRRRLTIGAVIVMTAVFAAATSSAGAVPRSRVTYTDVPVAGAHDTHVMGVTTEGVIAGYYGDAPEGSPTHGFIKQGETVATIDVPGASSTLVRSINDAETVVGSYYDVAGIEHGFVRVSGGDFVTFDAPALVGTDATVYGTVASGVNASGVIVGYSYTVGPDLWFYDEGEPDPITRYHGFVRSSDGTMTTYDAPGAMTVGGPHVGTRLFGINTAGNLVGAFSYLKVTRTDTYPMDAGFLVAGKKFTRIVSPDVPTNSCGWTEPRAVNDLGVMVGESGNACGGTYGGWMLSGGKWTFLSYVVGEDVGQYVDARSINDLGVIGGYWGGGQGDVSGFTATTR